MKNNKLLSIVPLILASGFGLNCANAAATRIAYVDPFATARGNAFAATADNPSAVFYNAAGLTQLEGTQVQAQVFAISLDYEYDADLFGSGEMDDGYQPVPSFFASHSFADLPISIGFGSYAPFALGSDWGSDASFTAPFFSGSPTAFTPHKADLKYIKYHGVVAWQINKTLSVAVGLSYDDTEVDLKSNALDFEGKDELIGYSLSVLWRPDEKHSFGLNYQAKTEAKYDGSVSGPAINFFTQGAFNELDAEAELIFPESIIFGYAYRPNEKWNIEFNLDWTNWDRVNELSLDTALPLPAYQLNWESAFIWELGATRYFDNGWHISGGYTFVENAVPDAEFLPIVPDSDRHFLALGVGRSYENLSWQFTVQQAFDDGRSVSNNTYALDGDWEQDSTAFAMSLNYRF